MPQGHFLNNMADLSIRHRAGGSQGKAKLQLKLELELKQRVFLNLSCI